MSRFFPACLPRVSTKSAFFANPIETALHLCCEDSRASVSSSTLRVRRHRERRRERLHLFTVEVPEDLIDEALARGLLKPEDRADWWAVIQACYAAQLSDVALDWLTNGGVDIGCWEHGCWSGDPERERSAQIIW